MRTGRKSARWRGKAGSTLPTQSICGKETGGALHAIGANSSAPESADVGKCEIPVRRYGMERDGDLGSSRKRIEEEMRGNRRMRRWSTWRTLTEARLLV